MVLGMTFCDFIVSSSAEKSTLLKYVSRSLATLGALVILTTLAVDPFVQQVLSYHLHPIMKQSNTTIASYSRSFGTGGDSDPTRNEALTSTALRVV